jgi:hypothetical protein
VAEPEPVLLGSPVTGLHDVAIGDGETEIVIATAILNDGALHVIDGRKRDVEALYTDDDGSPLSRSRSSTATATTPRS